MHKQCCPLVDEALRQKWFVLTSPNAQQGNIMVFLPPVVALLQTRKEPSAITYNLPTCYVFLLVIIKFHLEYHTLCPHVPSEL